MAVPSSTSMSPTTTTPPATNTSRPPRKVLSPSIPTRKASVPQTSRSPSQSSVAQIVAAGNRSAGPVSGTSSGSNNTTASSSRDSQTPSAFKPSHGYKTSDTPSLAHSWIDPDSLPFNQLGQSIDDSSSTADLAATQPAPGLGISGLASPEVANVEALPSTQAREEVQTVTSSGDPTPLAAMATTAAPLPLPNSNPSPAAMSARTSSEANSNYSPFTPPSVRAGPSSFSNASPGGRRKTKPDNLTISPIITNSTAGVPSTTPISAPSPLFKGLASPTARGRTPPPTQPPTEPLPPLPSSASLVASSWSKRLSDEEKYGRMARLTGGVTSPGFTPPASSHPYAALRNIPPTSFALQQAMGVNPPPVRTTRLSDPSTSSDATKEAKLAVANNHMETLAGAHSAAAVLRAVKPEATFNEQQQQQQQQQKDQAEAIFEASHDRNAPLSRRSDPEASRLLPRHLDVPRPRPRGEENGADSQQEHLRDEDDGVDDKTNDEDDDEDDDNASDIESDVDSVQEVAIVRTGTLVSPLRKGNTGEDNLSRANSIGNGRAQLLRASINSAHVVRRPGTGESPKDGGGAGSFFIGGSLPQKKGERNSVDDAPARLSVTPSARRPVVTENSHAHRNSLVADAMLNHAATDSHSDAATPTPDQPGLSGVEPVASAAYPRVSTLAPPDAGQQASALRESILDPLRFAPAGGEGNTTAVHSRNDSVDTAGSSVSDASRALERQPSRGARGASSATPHSSHETTIDGGAPASPAAFGNGKFSSAFGQIAIAFRQLQAEKRTLEKVIRATTPLEGLGDGAEDFVRYLTTMQSKLEMSSSEIQKLLDLLERQRAVMDYMLETHQTEIDTHLDEVDDLRDELDEAIAHIEALKSANTASQEALDTSRAEAMAGREEAAKLRVALAERDRAAEVHEAARAELDQLRKEREHWAAERAETDQRHKALDETNTEQLSRIRAIETELAALGSAHQIALEKQGAEHEREIWNLKDEHEQVLADHNAEIEKAAEQLADHHGRALELLKGEHLQTIDELQARIAAMESSQDASLSARRQLLDAVDGKDEQIAQLSHEVAQLRKTVEEGASSLQEQIDAAREEERQKLVAVEQKAASASAERDELKTRLQEHEIELDRLRSLVAGRRSTSRSRSDSNSFTLEPLAKDDVPSGDSHSESEDSIALQRPQQASGTVAPTTPGNTEDVTISSTTMTPTASGIGVMSGSPVTPINLPRGPPAEQVRQLVSQLTEQRKRESHIRSAYKQLRDDHRRLQNSHKDMVDRRRGSIGNFNLLAGPGSANGHGHGGNGGGSGSSLLAASPSSLGPSPYLGSSGDPASQHSPAPLTATAIASITGSGSATNSPTTSRALKRLSLPLTSSLINGGGNGQQLNGFPDHVLAALGTPGGITRFGPPPSGSPAKGGDTSQLVGLASFPHPPGSYRGPIVPPSPSSISTGSGGVGASNIDSFPAAPTTTPGGGGYFLARPRLTRPGTADVVPSTTVADADRHEKVVDVDTHVVQAERPESPDAPRSDHDEPL